MTSQRRPVLIVLAKAPIPGRSKTRLCPPCSFEQAAAVAEAALADTLATVAATPASARFVALEGPVGPWILPGFDVISQRGGGLDERIANAMADAAAPALLIGMDTPQVTRGQLIAASEALMSPGVDGVLGPAKDGGWWAMGVREAWPEQVIGVPMSCPETLAEQRRRWSEIGMRWTELPVLQDIDTFADARAVAGAAPLTGTAAVVRSLSQDFAGAGVRWQ